MIIEGSILVELPRRARFASENVDVTLRNGRVTIRKIVNRAATEWECEVDFSTGKVIYAKNYLP